MGLSDWISRGRHRAAASRAARLGVRRRLIPVAGKELPAGDRPLVALALVEHLGDIVAAEPLVSRVRRLHPQAALVWVVRPAYRALVARHPDLDAVLEVRCLTEWIRLRESPEFAHVYDFHLDGRDCSICKVPIRRADPAITLRDFYERGNLLNAFALAAGLEPIDVTPRLHFAVDPEELVTRLELPPRYVVIHGRANQQEREWSDDKWANLVERLREIRAPMVIEVGLERVAGEDRERFRSLAGKLSLAESAALIRRATLFVGIDSGPAHLANATGTRGVVLLGHWSRFRDYMPFSGRYADGSGARILRHAGPAAEIPVERVLHAIELELRAEADR